MRDRYLGMTIEQLNQDHLVESDDGWFCDTCRRPVEDGGFPGLKTGHVGTRPDDFD